MIPLSGTYLLILFLGITISYIFNEFENGLFFQPADKGNLKTFQLPDTFILFEIPLIQMNDACKKVSFNPATL